MAINFPSNPNDGDTHTDPTSGNTYKYFATIGVWRNHPDITTWTGSTGPTGPQSTVTGYTGYTGPTGPYQPVEVYAQTSVTGSITINRNNGECQRLSVAGNVTSTTISNFGATGYLSKLCLEIWNTGAYTFAWPSGTIWSGGITPALTSGSGKKDVYIFVTFDGGTTIYGNVLGQDYA